MLWIFGLRQLLLTNLDHLSLAEGRLESEYLFLQAKDLSVCVFQFFL